MYQHLRRTGVHPRAGRNRAVTALTATITALALTSCGGRTQKLSVAPSAPARAYHGGQTAAEPGPAANRERYEHIEENDLVTVADHPLSTFSIDVDTASYSNVRRFLRDGQMPPADAVRIEELINYFDYDYPEPESGDPFAVATEVGPSPWNPERRLVHIGLQGRSLESESVPPRNLVFLLDVSGSMSSPDKLPLMMSAMKLLVEQLGERDRVAIAVYAGAAGTVLPPTSGADAHTILDALDRLRAGGSTNGGQGIHLAYSLAEQNHHPDAINRVILATDGDFNVGTSSDGELVRLIEKKRESGTSLSVLGFGTGNLNDSMMEKLSGAGNGNYAYIDSIDEARKVLVDQAGSTLVTIAKDVKVQVEFNPKRVAAYRLIGYENRLLNDEDFTDDSEDAGEIGAGHTVTALYEVVPTGADAEDVTSEVEALRYQDQRASTAAADSDELMWLKIRHKQPDGDTSTERSYPIVDPGKTLADTGDDFRFSAAVAGFGMLLRDSKYAERLTIGQVEQLAREALGADRHGYRGEFLDLVTAAAPHLERPSTIATDG